MTTFRRKPLPDLGLSSADAAGEYRDVTILFADLEGFTALAERSPPSEVVALLNEYFTAMTQVVMAFGGSVDKYIGDALLVVWDGEPRWSAEQASRAALAMQLALVGLQEKWILEGKLPLKNRIGICSGRVIAGRIGSPIRYERTVIGDAVNAANRLEALNKEYCTDIIISQSTYEHVSAGARVRALGIVVLKGRREPMGIYALLGWNAHGE